MKSEKVLVALEADDPVVMDESAGVLLSMLMIVGLLGVLASVLRSLSSITTTSDMVGLRFTGDCVHIKAISMIFFTSCSLYSLGSKVSSTSFSGMPVS